MNSALQNQIVAAIYQEAQQRFSELDDPAHGWEHVRRVYNQALYIAQQEGADIFIVEIAALLHDLGRLVPKKGIPHARLSVDEANKLLNRYEVKPDEIKAILHAIEAHSFSQKSVQPQTLEAQVVRDADRLDGMGAIGILRWAITGTIKRKRQTQSYHPDDPFAEWHELDDRLYMLDHFYTKLLKLQDSMSTETGRILAEQRSAYMQGYIQEFKLELGL